MKPTTLLSFLTGIALCLSFSLASAQPPQFRAQLNNMQFNNQMRMQNNMMMQTLNLHGVTGTGEMKFIVTMRDSSQIKLKSAVYTDSVTRRRFVVLEDKKYKKNDTNRYERIYPSQTLSIRTNTGYESWAKDNWSFDGKPNDTCWMFVAINGPLTAYSYVSIYGVEMDPSILIGLKLNDGPIVPYNADNLKQMITSDPKAMEYFDKKKYVKAIAAYDKDIEKKK